jgi:hypothetical protein
VGPQQHGVDGGDGEAFVEQCLVAENRGEEDAQLAGGQAAQGVLALLAGGIGAEGFGGEAGGVEPGRHEAGVLHAHAKPQGAHALGIGELVVELAQDQGHAVVIAGVELRELGGYRGSPHATGAGIPSKTTPQQADSPKRGPT